MASGYSSRGPRGALGRLRSIGWRTDVALRELEGAELLDGRDRLLVRTPANPGYRWGNYMLLHAPPGAGEGARWIDRFQAAFPGAAHVAIGVDDPSGAPHAAAEAAALALEVTVNSVLLADARRGLRAPRGAAVEATFRAMRSERDWERAAELSLASDGLDASAEIRAYVESRMQARRKVCEEGRGAWLGAFLGEQMCAGLGIFDTGSGHARLQEVETHPAFRRKGLARNLVYEAGRFAAGELAASTLVTAADPGYHAIAMYRSLGFEEHERQARFERAGPAG